MRRYARFARIGRPAIRRGASGLLTLAAVFAVLLATISAGLAVPSTQRLNGIAAPAVLDYVRPAFAFARLSERFVSRVLGLHTGTQSPAPGVRLGRGAADLSSAP